MTTWDDYVQETAENARVAAVTCWGAVTDPQRDTMLGILASNANRITRARRLQELGVECPA